MKEQFEHKNFRADTLEVIEQANDIISKYARQGFSLTLRQLYYQFVASDLIENSQRSYKRLGSIVMSGRMAGLIDWSAIEDRAREHKAWLIEEDEQSVLSGIEYGLSLDYWEPQDTYVECWVEKDALSDVIRRPCSKWRVPYMACKGYTSASAAYEAGKRFKFHQSMGRKCVLLHLGDHDPSGLDMTRDNSDRINRFARTHGIEVQRLGLNMDQVEEYNPPPNFAKDTDSRWAEYEAEFGPDSWELDALEPSVIIGLIDEAVEKLIDIGVWDATRNDENYRRENLAKLHDNWDDVREFVESL